jgi:hypothetical protein
MGGFMTYSKDGQKRAGTTGLPVAGHLTKMSSALCATAFDDLEMALLVLEAGGKYLNPVQRELVDRFANTTKTFARDMLAAEGNQNALRMTFGLPPIKAK